MVQIPIKKLLIEQEVENKQRPQDLRSYIGMSGIANNCERKIWNDFRWIKKKSVTPRVQRLLSRGHNEEPIIIRDLEEIGIKVYGLQERLVCGHGHIRGHTDGIAIGIPDAPKTEHLLEFKTANDKNFKKFVKENNLEKAHSLYYGQVCCYMYMLKLTRCLFIVVNKNTDERYYERVDCNNDHAIFLFSRAENILQKEEPPQKIGGANWFECKFCDYYDICHYNEPINKSCRSCKFFDICENGKFECSKHDIELATQQQHNICKHFVQFF